MKYIRLKPSQRPPWPTRRPPTSDNNSPITKRIRTNETPKCFSNLGDCSRLSKEARRWNSRAGLYSSGLHACVECKLTSRTTNSKKTKKRRPQDTSNYSKLQEKAGKVQTKANTANTFRALLLRRCGCGLAYKRMWVWFRAHAHKNNAN